MKALIERSLYQPAIILPILMLVRLMTTLDFSVTQVALVLAFRGSRYVFNLIMHREEAGARLEDKSTARHARPVVDKAVVRSSTERTCHC